MFREVGRFVAESTTAGVAAVTRDSPEERGGGGSDGGCRGDRRGGGGTGDRAGDAGPGRLLVLMGGKWRRDSDASNCNMLHWYDW